MTVHIHSFVLLSLWPVLLQTQPAAQPPAPATDTMGVSLDRIRRELQTSEVTIRSAEPGLPPVFRVEVIDRFLRYEHLWKDDGLTPEYVRPSRGLVHHEFLNQVTPDLFRGVALHPCCDVLPLLGLVKDGIGKMKRSIDEGRARKEVRESLAELMRQREKEKAQQENRNR
jgi:hypothetical protein